MLTSRPYLLRAMYEWIVANQLTPYILVAADYPEVEVPQRYVQNNKILLNISPKAVRNLRLENYAIDFETTFSGIVEYLYVPIRAIESIYAAENGRGMRFEPDNDDDPPPLEKRNLQKSPSKAKKGKKRPKLVVVE
jgi:stringent starvation protein B